MTTQTIETKDDLKLAILRHLKQGEANAIHKADLMKCLGLKGDREERLMRLTIVELRHTGEMILSSQKGYFIAHDLDEIKATYEYWLKYVKSIGLDLKDLKRMINNYSGQTRMKL